MVERKKPSEDNPKEIADYLIQEHGLEQAIVLVGEGVEMAKAVEDNYVLSVCREVKVVLEKARQGAAQ